MTSTIRITIAVLLLPAATASAMHAQSAATLFRDTRVFDGERVHEQTSVLVRDGVIAAIGADIDVPAGATVAAREETQAGRRAGLQGMRARIEACGGTVARTTGRGLLLRIAIPAAQTTADAACDSVRSAS